MAIWRRQAQLDGLVHHSDRGSPRRIQPVVATPRARRCGWDDHRVGLQRRREGRRCGRLGVRRLGVRSSACSGRGSPRGCRARTLRWPAACLRRWDRGGSATLAACHRSASSHHRDATCRSPSARRSHCSTPSSSGCVRSPGSWGARRRRSLVSCAATRRRGAASWSIGRRSRSGRPSVRRGGPRRPSLLSTTSCTSTCKPGSPARWPPLTERRFGARRFVGQDDGTVAARTGAGRPPGARNRSPTGCRSTSPMMSPCGSPTRRSTRRSTFRAAVRCDESSPRVCAPAVRCECHKPGPAGGARSSSPPKS